MPSYHSAAFFSALVAVSRADYIGVTTRNGACDAPVFQTGAYYNGCFSLPSKSAAIVCKNASYATLNYYNTTTCSGGVSETIDDIKLQPWGCTPAPANSDLATVTYTCVAGTFTVPPSSIVQELYLDQTSCPQQGSPFVTIALPSDACLTAPFSQTKQSTRYSSNASSVLAALYNTTTCSGPVVDSADFPLGCERQGSQMSAAIPLWASPLAAAFVLPTLPPPIIFEQPAQRLLAGNITSSPTTSPSPTMSPSRTPTPSPTPTRLAPSASSTPTVSPSSTRIPSPSSTPTAAPAAPSPAPQSNGLTVWRVTGPAPSSNSGPSPAVIGGAVGGTIAALAALGGVFYYVKARPHAQRQAESVKLLG